ncbi:Scramblase [Oesophagostomum dentatum]|uniref:Phospholipid scramblase n=1 Tax=Oesophagostomum dentatum TaxID=61180 RepID=A0A0B1TC73_OESDE|nr:Scramblase [Oesophagostomum dentatum]
MVSEVQLRNQRMIFAQLTLIREGSQHFYGYSDVQTLLEATQSVICLIPTKLNKYGRLPSQFQAVAVKADLFFDEKLSLGATVPSVVLPMTLGLKMVVSSGPKWSQARRRTITRLPEDYALKQTLKWHEPLVASAALDDVLNIVSVSSYRITRMQMPKSDTLRLPAGVETPVMVRRPIWRMSYPFALALLAICVQEYIHLQIYTLYYAVEEGNFFTMQRLRENRPFTMHMIDNAQRDVMVVKSPSRVCAGCPCFGEEGLARCFAEAPPGYRVLSINGGVIGCITKHWSGAVQEAISDADTFSATLEVAYE